MMAKNIINLQYTPNLAIIYFTIKQKLFFTKISDSHKMGKILLTLMSSIYSEIRKRVLVLWGKLFFSKIGFLLAKNKHIWVTLALLGQNIYKVWPSIAQICKRNIKYKYVISRQSKPTKSLIFNQCALLLS